MISLLIALLLPTAGAQDLDDNGCLDSFEANNACVTLNALVAPSSTIGASSQIRSQAMVGPQTAVGDNVTVAERASLAGRLAHPSNPLPVGDDVVVGRRSVIGADHVLGTGTLIGRSVTAGPNLSTGADVFVGYGTQIGSDVTLGADATLGSLVDVGDHAVVGASAILARDTRIASAASAGEGTVVNGIVGPASALGTEVLIAAGARLRKNVTAEDGVTVESTGRVGRDVTLGAGSTVRGTVGAGAQIGAGAVVGDGATVPRGGEVCPSAVVPDGLSVGSVYPEGGCVTTTSCLSILNSGGSTGDGLYTIDPDGEGGAAPYPVYCDMSTDDGGWTLVARIASGTSAHRNDASVGTLTGPTQGTAAKLADTSINDLRGPDFMQSVLRFSCGSVTAYFQEDKPFSATLLGASAIDRCAPTWDATTWYEAVPYFSHGGAQTWQRDAECGYLIYTVGDNGYLGCYSQNELHNQNGTLWVK